MDNLNNLEETKKWLAKQPRNVILVFAARAALRAVPYSVDTNDGKNFNQQSTSIILPSLWASASALFAGVWLDMTRVKSATSAASNAGANAFNVGAVEAGFAADAASSANAAANATRISDVIHHAATAVDLATHVGSAAEFYDEYSLDRDFIEEGGGAQSLAVQKLWRQFIPANILMYNDTAKRWSALKYFLEMQKGQDWEVWTEWYEARLKGEPFIEEIEIGLNREYGTGAYGEGVYGGQKFGRVTFPPEDYKDPAIINPKIKSMIEDYWARQNELKQDVSAEAFAINDDGQVDRVTSQTSPELTDTPTQRDWYESLREAAESLQDLGDNALGRAARPVSNLLDEVPKELSDAKVARLWPAANRIRRLKSAHDKAIALGDAYHPNLLSSEVVDDIDQFVGVYNNLLVRDENLALADQKALGPRDQSEIIEANGIAAEIISEAIEHDLLTDEAKEALSEVEQENVELAKLKDEGGELSILEQLALDNNARINDNAMRAFIVRVRDSKIYNNKGTIFASAVASRMLEYAISKLPSLVNLIRPIFGL